MIKLGVLTTHPIQYQIPWFRALSEIPEVDLTVFFCMLPNKRQQGDGFNVAFEWDIPLLEGYRYRILENVSKAPSVTTFLGCDTPDVHMIVKKENFDAFIVNGWVAKSCLQLLAACRRYRVPCIVRGESNTLRPRAWWKRAVHRLLLSNYAAFLHIGKANRDFYLRNGIKAEQIFFAPYCVDNERFAAAARTLAPMRKELRKDWNIPEDSFVFLFCAKFVPKKRPMDLLMAIDRVVRRKNAPSAHALLVGAGEMLTDCRAFVKVHGTPASFAGFLNQSEIPRAYVAADCIVLPSDNGETWGLVVNEAMACGLPAVVSDQVGCHPDLIVPGVTGELFHFGDTVAMAERLEKLARHPERTENMGEAARRRIRGYCYERVVRGTLAALEWLKRR